MPLDTRTLIIVSLLTSIVIGLVLHLTWRINRAMPALHHWSAGFLFYAAGLAEMALRPPGPPHVWNIVSILLLSAGHLSVLFGTRSLIGRPLPWRGAALGLSAASAVWLYHLLVEPDFSRRYAAYAVLVSVVAGLAAADLFRIRRDRWLSAVTVLMALYGLVALGNGVRAVVLITVGVSEGLMDAGPMQTWQFLQTNILLVTAGVCMVVVSTERLQDELRRAATYDRLTGVLNRGAFVDLAEREVARWRRTGGTFSVLLMDIDHFKRINDSFGHAVGDATLAAFAARCTAGLRGGDLLSRYGGEEFCALLPGADHRQAALVAERLRRDVAMMEVEHEGVRVPVSVSIGVAEADRMADGLDALIARADAALYRAKRAGRNRVETAGPAAGEPASRTVMAP